MVLRKLANNASSLRDSNLTVPKKPSEQNKFATRVFIHIIKFKLQPFVCAIINSMSTVVNSKKFMSHFVQFIDVSDQVDMTIFNDWTASLGKLRSLDPEMLECAVYGGAVLDRLLGLKPSDIDVMYESDGNKCRCVDVRKILNDNCVFGSSTVTVDIGSVQEHKPKLQIVEFVTGHFSYHSENISKMVLTDNGRLLVNSLGWDDFNNRTYELSNHGGLMWREWRKQHHHTESLWCFFATELVRVLSYVSRRQLNLGRNAASFIAAWRTIADNATTEDMVIPTEYAKKKNLNPKSIRDVVVEIIGDEDASVLANWILKVQ